MWYQQADRVIALTQEQLLTPPDSAPTLRINLYPNLPFLDQNDEACSVKVGSAAPTSGLCEACQKNPYIPCKHTLVGTSSLENALAMFVVIVVAMIAPHNCCAIRKVGLCQSS